MRTELLTLIDERIEILEKINKEWEDYIYHDPEFSILPDRFKELAFRIVILNKELIEDGKFLRNLTTNFEYLESIKKYLLFADRTLDFVQNLLNLIN